MLDSVLDTIFPFTFTLDHLFNATIGDNGYNVSIVAEWFHQIPHLDIRLHLVNSTFDPHDNEYLEALGILVAIPGFWLIITLLFFLIFFLCRCCDVNSKKKRKLTCCKLCLFLFGLICCATITVGILGTFESHNGMVKVQNSTTDLANVLHSLRNKTNAIEDLLSRGVDSDLNKLGAILSGPLVKNSTVHDILQDQLLSMRRNVTKGMNRIGDINSKVDRLNVDFIPRNINKVEQIRWPATFSVLGVLIFVCLVLILGILRHSRCVLILFSVLGLLSLVVCWVMTSVYLGLSVAGSDFCLEPKPFISKQFSGVVDSSITNYYLECDKEIANPFRKPLKDGRRAVDNVHANVQKVSRICDQYCPDREVKNILYDISSQLNQTEDIITLIGNTVECDHVHQDYIDTMSATCKDILEGVFLMLASAAATGLCFTILVLCASHTWINIRKKRPVSNDQNDETDPFLPPASSTSTTSSANSKRLRDTYGSGGSGRPRFSHTPPQTPHFPGPTSTPPSINGRNMRDDQLAFFTPPPSYEQVGHHSHQAVGPHYVVSYRK